MSKKYDLGGDLINWTAVLVTADLARALLISLPVFTQDVNAIYAIALLVAMAATFFCPTVQAVIPALVSEDALLAANSVAWSTEQLVQIYDLCKDIAPRQVKKSLLVEGQFPSLTGLLKPIVLRAGPRYMNYVAHRWRSINEFSAPP